MERLDRAFVVLAAFAFIVYLIILSTPREKNKMPNTRVMLSPPTLDSAVGPAYLTSNLPIRRDSDDELPQTTVDGNASVIGATAI